ncbi:MAG: hypothetical protein L0Y56_22420 [Nitrospira sp.]|nr:hypothetical protein [Nitrospira sp.]
MGKGNLHIERQIMFRAMSLISILLAFFLVTACNKGSGDQQQPIASGPGEMVNPPGFVMTPPAAVPTGGGVISGIITLDPSLASKVTETNVVYIIARSADMPGPPVAVQQLRNIKFPYQYALSSADLMMQGGSFQGKVNIVVRVDKDGAAGPPQSGDLEGIYSKNPATVGDQKVDIVINKAF